MRFVSTRRGLPGGSGGKDTPGVSFSEAALGGMAPDGGLYVPEELPAFGPERRASLVPLLEDYAAFSSGVLRPFFEADMLDELLDQMCRTAFDFPVSLVPLERGTSMLELYHGPTAAFKDVGARFLAVCFEELLRTGRVDRLAVLVATSGDTGSAVAAAFHGRAGVRVGVLYPKGGVSPRQEHQLTCWDENVSSYAVRGTFDDCQRLVKAAFDANRLADIGLTSANSINIGRLLPQVVYYAWASMAYVERHGRPAGFVVPSGNMGNALAAFWAREMGFPLRCVAIATNANRVVPDWFESGRWEPRASVATLANAMDVGAPSNMERLLHLFPTPTDARGWHGALSVTDDHIRAAIVSAADVPPATGRWGRVVCPHTATALHYREKIGTPDWVVVATADPAKFDGVVEPLVGRSLDVPSQLLDMLERPTRSTEIDADLDALSDEWLGAPTESDP